MTNKFLSRMICQTCGCAVIQTSAKAGSNKRWRWTHRTGGSKKSCGKYPVPVPRIPVPDWFKEV